MLAKPLRRAARRLQRALDAVPSAEDHDMAIHEARKATKRARYAAEAAAPALGRTASRHAAQAKELQQLLGDHHNSVVAPDSTARPRRRKARAAGEDTFTYGLMYECQACQAAIIEQTLPRFTAALSDRTTVPASAAGLRKRQSPTSQPTCEAVAPEIHAASGAAATTLEARHASWTAIRAWLGAQVILLLAGHAGRNTPHFVPSSPGGGLAA